MVSLCTLSVGVWYVLKDSSARHVIIKTVFLVIVSELDYVHLWMLRTNSGILSQRLWTDHSLRKSLSFFCFCIHLCYVFDYYRDLFLYKKYVKCNKGNKVKFFKTFLLWIFTYSASDSKSVNSTIIHNEKSTNTDIINSFSLVNAEGTYILPEVLEGT